MNVEIGAEAALFPEKEYINGIALQCMQPDREGIFKSFECSFLKGGVVSRDEYFLKAFYDKYVVSVLALIVFEIFCFLLE
jgi:hypothetical protein